MNKVESIFKNIALFLLGAIIFIVGYNINQSNHPDGNSGATSMESNEAEEDANSGASQ